MSRVIFAATRLVRLHARGRPRQSLPPHPASSNFFIHGARAASYGGEGVARNSHAPPRVVLHRCHSPSPLPFALRARTYAHAATRRRWRERRGADASTHRPECRRDPSAAHGRAATTANSSRGAVGGIARRRGNFLRDRFRRSLTRTRSARGKKVSGNFAIKSWKMIRFLVY